MKLLSLRHLQKLIAIIVLRVVLLILVAHQVILTAVLIPGLFPLLAARQEIFQLIFILILPLLEKDFS